MSTGSYFEYKDKHKKEQEQIDVMYRTISFGSEPKKERSLSLAPSAAAAATKFHKDKSNYTYHEIHLDVPCAEEFKPTVPEDLLRQMAGVCLKCASSRSTSLSRVDSESMVSCTHVNSSKPQGSIRKPGKSILSSKGTPGLTYQNFIKSVSFDTVNISYSDGQELVCSPRSDSEDDDMLLTRNRWRSQLDRNRQLSPSRSLSPLSSRSGENSNVLPYQLDRGINSFISSSSKYPTKPIITHDSCSLTKKHSQYDDLYGGRLSGKHAKLPNREIMCYISGRKHTWTAIDWCCNQFLEDGDSLVIVASIRPQGRSLSRLTKKQYDSGTRLATSVGNITENKIRNSPEWSQSTAENIMKYCLAVLNPRKIVKISVELCVGSSEEVLSDMFALYQPSLVVTGTKPANNPPTMSWATKRLTDRLVSTLPVPMIVVPSKNMGMFESKLFGVLNERMSFMNENNKNVTIQRDELIEKLDRVGDYSLADQHKVIIESGPRDEFIEKDLRDTILEKKKQLRDQKMLLIPPDATSNNDSYSDVSDDNSDEISVDSANPPTFQPKKTDVNMELKRMELEYQLKVYQQFEIFEKNPLNENSFKDKLCIVMDAASKYGHELADATQTSDSAASKLFRDFIGAPELTRTKSMVPVTATKQSDKELQDAMIAKYQQMQQQQQQQNPTNQVQNSKRPTPKIKINSMELSPNLSPKSSKPELITSLSQQDIGSKQKKKKKSFWGIFKS